MHYTRIIKKNLIFVHNLMIYKEKLYSYLGEKQKG